MSSIGVIECYRLNADGTTTMVADGINTIVPPYSDNSDDSVPCLSVMDIKKMTTSIYNTNNELVLVLAISDVSDEDALKEFDDAIVVTIELDDGRYKTFVFGDKTVEASEDNVNN